MALPLLAILGMLTGGGGIGGLAGKIAGKNIPGLKKVLGGGTGIGSLLGGGAAIASLLGGKGLSKLFLGDPAKEQQIQRFTPEQQSTLDQLMQQGQEQTGMDGVEGLARKRFQEDTIPSLAERFTSMGAGGQRSSAFESSLGRAGSDLEAQLAALRQQGGMQKLGLGLQPRFDTGYSPASQGLFGAGASSLMSLLPLLAGL